MAKYKQVKRDGRWVTINTETGKEVKPGEGQLGDFARQGMRALRKFGDNLVYSDKTDSKGRPLTRAQANAGTDAEGRKPKVGDTKKDGKGRTLVYTGKGWKLKSSLEGKDSALNRYRTPSGQPTGSRRNWRNGQGAQSNKPSEGDRSTWPTKKTTTTSSGSSSGSSSGTTNTSGGSSSSSSSSSSTTRRKPTGQGSRGFTMKRDLGKELKISTSGKTESKPKSRLDKALSNVGKWEEPKTKRKPNKKNRDKWVNR